MNQLSLENYWTKVEPSLNDRQKTVLEKIKELGKSTSIDIAEALNTRINCISGRITELRDKGIIKESGRKKIGSSSFTVWEVK